MYTIRFMKGTDLVAVKISGTQILFGKIYGNALRLGSIEGLKLNVGTILEEFPDLKGRPHKEIKEIAIQRFKDHIKNLPNEKARKDYVIEDLEKHGYKKGLVERAGFRPKND